MSALTWSRLPVPPYLIKWGAATLAGGAPWRVIGQRRPGASAAARAINVALYPSFCVLAELVTQDQLASQV